MEQDFVIKLPAEQVDHTQPKWYLPLQAVFTSERTTKVRLVFDASLKGHDGLSLNDHLEKGPNYINSLPNVLMAWDGTEWLTRVIFRKCLMKSHCTLMTKSFTDSCGEVTKVKRP